MINMQLEQAAKAINGTMIGNNLSFNGCSTDTRTIKPGQLFIALKGEQFDAHTFLPQAVQGGAVAAIVQTDCVLNIPYIKVDNTRLAMGKLAQAWRLSKSVPVIAVTGSNGKTTVKEMLKAILSIKAEVLATQGNLNNDIGVPLTLFRMADNQQYAVIEIGANHEGEIAVLTQLVKPDVAVITQCAPAHLEGFGSIEGVSRAKGEIYQGLNDNGIAVINADDTYADYWRGLNKERHKILFGFSSEADVSVRILEIDNSLLNQFELNYENESITITLPIPGRHNIMNALAAAACSLALGITLQDIRLGLENMHGVAGRLQVKHLSNNMTVIDDTYNANPGSLSAAFEVLMQSKGQKWLALGDMGELGEESLRIHADMGAKAKRIGIHRLFTIGTSSQAAVQAFGEGATHFENHQTLIEAICLNASKNTTLLVKGSRNMQMERVVDALTQQEIPQC